VACSRTAFRETMISLMLEAVRTSETLFNIYLTTRKYIPEDSELLTRRRENLKSHINTPCDNIKMDFVNRPV
jgi:hypothetical protein